MQQETRGSGGPPICPELGSRDRPHCPGDIRLQLLPVVVLIAEFGFFGLALFFTLKNKLGPLFWAVATGTGVALGWLAHFSPFTDQTLQFIYHAYATPAAGWLAVAWLVALMLNLTATAMYAEYLWARGLR